MTYKLMRRKKKRINVRLRTKDSRRSDKYSKEKNSDGITILQG